MSSDPTVPSDFSGVSSSKHSAGGRVAVVIPTHRLHLTPEEEFSLRVCKKVLGSHPIHIITSEGCSGAEAFAEAHPTVRIVTLPHRSFGSTRAVNRLLMSPDFYRPFADFEFILIHHLDALVFHDLLLDWCGRGFDYVGAPFLSEAAPTRLLGVGNGGFSLRRTATFLRITQSVRLRRRADWMADLPARVGVRNIVALKFLMRFSSRFTDRTLRWMFFEWYQTVSLRWHEDTFFSWFSPFFVEEFRKPSAAEAVAFAVEREPRRLVALLQGALPFGCHGYWRHDPDFIAELAREAGINDCPGSGMVALSARAANPPLVGI